MKLNLSKRCAVSLFLFAGCVFLPRSQAQENPKLMTTGLPKEFASATAAVNGTTLHYVRGGKGPALVLIHGFPQDWFEYHAIMPRLAERFTVIAVDLRGVGGSAATANGYDAANMAQDIHELVTHLKLERVYLVGHDIGGMVAYAFVRRFPAALRGAMILDAPIPGIEGWNEAMASPAVWHVGFMQVPGLAEKLVADRTADYLNYFFSFGKFSPGEVEHYIKEAYGSASQLDAMFEIYRAFPVNEKFNAAQRERNDVPLFVGAGDGSPFAKLIPQIAEGFRANGCTHVETGLIHDSVHYVVSDQPKAVTGLIEQHASPAK
jgi:pimeloyl-ACP methyl ester carboxylesterase